MRRKILWMGVSCLMAISLVLAACGPAATPPTTTPPTTTPPTTTPPTTEPPQKEAVAPATDQPKYGGTFTLTGTSPTFWGAAISNRAPAQSGYVLQKILNIDRTKGPAGSGQVDYSGGATSFDDVVGFLAESWKTPEVGVWVLDIRRGVHFALDPTSAASRLVNGREMTAEDVAYSIEYIRDTPSSWINLAEPTFIKNTTVERTGPWQITIKTAKDPATGYLWIMGGGGNGYIWPKEFLQKYGTTNEWRDQVGTGPYIITDFVADSSLTYRKNPNYWEKNPVGPGRGDQLPYVDGVKILIIPDASTRLAAFRSGKIDYLAGILLEDGQNLLKANPALKSYQTISAPYQVAMRTDKKELPYKDLRVRQALMMATDMEGMKQGLYKGQAEIIDSPARKLYTGVYTPLEQLPASTQELYKYNPEKAKQLLKEAGYPTGFKAKIAITTANADLAAVLKDQWSKVGIDLELQVKDTTVFNTLFSTRGYDELYFSAFPGGTGALFTRYGNNYFRGPNNFNLSYANDPPGSDPIIEQHFQDVQKYVMVNYPKAEEIMKQLNLYTMSQAFLIPTPAPYAYTMWQPWIKNYYGEGASEYWLQYLWIDQDLKKSLGR